MVDFQLQMWFVGLKIRMPRGGRQISQMHEGDHLEVVANWGSLHRTLKEAISYSLANWCCEWPESSQNLEKADENIHFLTLKSHYGSQTQHLYGLNVACENLRKRENVKKKTTQFPSNRR